MNRQRWLGWVSLVAFLVTLSGMTGGGPGFRANRPENSLHSPLDLGQSRLTRPTHPAEASTPKLNSDFVAPTPGKVGAVPRLSRPSDLPWNTHSVKTIASSPLVGGIEADGGGQRRPATASPPEGGIEGGRINPSSSSHCPPLPDPTGNIVPVATMIELRTAVDNATAGDTILLADGTYALDGNNLWVNTPNVTLRSASGNRAAVILDGNYLTTEIIQIVASNVTIADITLREALYHPIHVMSTAGGDTLNTLIYNVHIIDPGQQAIKINPYTQVGAVYFPDNGLIACSHLELTDAGRPQVWTINDSCYTGGIDAHQARDWVIRDNLIEGFWCPGEGDQCLGHELSEHGIHLWRGCRDTLVERNVLNNNARGIGFGLAASGNARTYPDDPCPGAEGGYVDHYGGIIRNNFVFANRSALFSSDCGFDSGIALWQACGARVLHNTVASTQAPTASAIEWRFDHTDVDVVNNLATDRLWDRGGTSSLAGNLTYQPLNLFVDGTNGDLHLVSSATVAIDQVVAPVDVTDDIDGDGRPIGPDSDIGADEHGISSVYLPVVLK